MSYLRLGLGIIIAVIAADQFSKWYILAQVMDPPRIIEVTPFFNIVLAWNKGVSFSMLSSESSLVSWGLSGFAILVCGVLGYFLVRAETKISATAFALIIGGAIGNVIDRIRYGAVVDFLDFYVKSYHWPAFNVADSAICLGAGFLILESIISKRFEK